MIHFIRKMDSFRLWRKACDSQNIGLVPTMGNLHDGHLSLVQTALDENEVVIVTIFVNPLQFGPNEDFEKYPRTLKEDIQKLNDLDNDSAEKKLVIFAPDTPKEFFPNGYSTSVDVDGPLTEILCGAHRPGHFKGVATIVYKLFSTTKPHRAYFGQKDYQQLSVIKRMVEDLDLDIDIKMQPIVREKDGLAMSSRNQYLQSHERKEALELYKTLQKVKDHLKVKKWSEIDQLKTSLAEDWDYLEVLRAEDLSTPSKDDKNLVVAGAMKVGSTRLIDNIVIKLP